MRRKKFVNQIGIKKDQNVCIINMPVVHRVELEELPKDVSISNRPVGKFDLVVLFTDSAEELQTAWDRLTNALHKTAHVIWVMYPEENTVVEPALLQIENIIHSDPVPFLDKWMGVKIEVRN